jgi:extracellular factor (EF) 3-hydroxypalmitic acid methyl ester biosynthesis protein
MNNLQFAGTVLQMAPRSGHEDNRPAPRRTRQVQRTLVARRKAPFLRVMDRYAAELQAGRYSQPIVAPIASALNGYRARVSREEWRETVERDLRTHPVVALLHQDPYTCYGFHKPRGYAGDAVLLDFIYGGGTTTPLVESATAMGSAIYHQCLRHPSSAAIRARRDHLASRMAALCRNGGCPDILSVGCGHLREAGRLERRAVPTGRFVALDQDAAILEVALADHPSLLIESAQRSIFSLLRSGQQLGTFDFIYSAGLYDYLSDDFASRLTEKLAAMLNPNGRLLIANMLTDFPGAGYMEAIMDWWLIYRTGAQLKRLAGRAAGVKRVRVYRKRHIAYMEIVKGAV